MNDTIDGAERGERLSAELAGLRERLRGVKAPPFEATGLPAALNERSREVQRHGTAVVPPVAARPPVARRWRVPLAAAAAVAAAGIAALLAVPSAFPPPETGARPAASPASRLGAPAPRAERGADGAAFQPLMYAPGFSPSGTYSVVRVRIPLSALAQGSRLEGTVEADLLVGEDGLASGIRFASTDTLFVSAGSH